MDFQSLTRRELQALCKKNNIPANLTNVAMADSLQALDIVDGIEDILNNPSVIKSEQSNIETPIAPRTSRRVPIKDDAVNSQIQTRTLRGAKTVVGEAHEKGKVDLPETQAGQISQGMAPLAPVGPKMETQLEIEKKEQSIQVEGKKDVLETPMATKAPRVKTTRSSAQCENHKVETAMSKVQTIRRSARLLERKLKQMSLNSTDEIEPAKLDEDGKENFPTKVETRPVVSSEQVEEVTHGIKTQKLKLNFFQIMDVEAEESEVTKEGKMDEDGKEDVPTKVETLPVVSSEEIEQVKQVTQAEESEVTKVVKMDEDDEIETEVLFEKLQKDKDADEDEMKTNEGMNVSTDLLEDQFDKSINFGDEIIEKKDLVVKD